MAAERGAPADPYAGLRQRAYLFLRDREGAAPEEELIAHVFGTAGNAALWRPLLRQVLGADERLALRSDGSWALRGATRPAPTQLLPTDFVVIDIETTGLRPLRQRIVEVAAIRYRGGARHDVFSTLINPGRSLPAYIRRLTGIDDAALAAAPPFAQIADALVAFLGDDLLVGYNVEFDVAFLNAELKRAGRPPLVNERLDLLPLSTQLVPGMRRSGLDAVSRALGLETRERHRAEPDAALTAMVLGKLSDLARERGLTTFDELRRAAATPVPVPRRRGAVGRGRAVLERSHLAGIPHAPGVYVMYGAGDRVIYVGKAKNLHNRVSSYYSQPLGYTRKMDGLLESIARIEVVETGSELEALLLEAQLIRRYRPQYNTQLRNNEAYPYIKVDIGNPWPRVTLTRQRVDDGAVYFGPFRVARAAREVVDLIHEVFPLRTCPRSFRTARSYGAPCLRFSLGQCLGPCTGSADREEYRRAVQDVLAFLRGDRDDVMARLHRQLAECAERLDFERAGRLRDRMRRVQQLVLSQQLLDETAQTGTVLIVTPSPEPGARELLLVVQGRLWAQIRAGADEDAATVAARLARSWERAHAAPLPPVDQDSLDEVFILGRWLRKHAGHPAIIPLHDVAPDWTALVAWARALDDAALTVETRRTPRPSEVGAHAGADFADGEPLC
ncbi:MAG: exonuclease domain-containing protein [Sphaerobacter sp.]|nr:exonuclease domain-containing protein [Sphaerobacter sp.]